MGSSVLKKYSGKSKRRWEDNNKMDLREAGCDCWEVDGSVAGLSRGVLHALYFQGLEYIVEKS